MALWPDGQERKANVYYIRLLDAAAAVEALREGKVVFVKPEDAEAVRESLHS